MTSFPVIGWASPSAAIRARVEAARQRQRERFSGMNITCNADMRGAEVRKFCKLDETGDSLVRAATSCCA